MRFYKVNAYTEDDDKFPVNTWVGQLEDVLDVARDLMENDESGIARFEVILDGTHPGWKVGQNPREVP